MSEVKRFIISIEKINIRLLTAIDIDAIVTAFAQNNWPKPASTFASYLQEQELGKRKVWVAWHEEKVMGYITLTWQSKYPDFKDNNIPEIMDLNVLPDYRKQGVASMLLETAEKEAAKQRKIVGIGVGLYGGPDGGYGAAQRLNAKRGYVPDGKGLTYNYKTATPFDNLPIDDGMVLWFTKKL